MALAWVDRTRKSHLRNGYAIFQGKADREKLIPKACDFAEAEDEQHRRTATRTHTYTRMPETHKYDSCRSRLWVNNVFRTATMLMSGTQEHLDGNGRLPQKWVCG